MAAGTEFEYTCTLKAATLEVAKRDLREDTSTRWLELKALRDRVQQYPGECTCWCTYRPYTLRLQRSDSVSHSRG